MIIKIYGQDYKVSKRLAASSKKTISQILEKVREESDVRGISQYYVAFVVMMYVISATILSSMSTRKLKQITEEYNKEDQQSQV